jgi:hypothetical protein
MEAKVDVTKARGDNAAADDAGTLARVASAYNSRCR